MNDNDQYVNDNNTIAYWNFNETNGNTLIDQSGNEYHGEIHGVEISLENSSVLNIFSINLCID